jgi:murein DD-endopeptidase MepM/ murein hydrolase activator NlpD
MLLNGVRGGVAGLFFLLPTLLLPQLVICMEPPTTGIVAPVLQGGNIASIPARSGKVRSKGKKQILDDPRRLDEIIEKAFQAVESANSPESDNLDLPVKGRISSVVGLRQDPINGRLRIHNGIDIAIPDGTTVTPIAPGKVIYSGLQPGYGNMVILRHGDGMVTIYAHHSRNLVKTGDAVDKKTTLAYSGSTGHSTGPHLHFEAWKGKVNVTEAFLPNFSGHHIAESSDASLDKTNLRKAILSDGTILFIEVANSLH